MPDSGNGGVQVSASQAALAAEAEAMRDRFAEFERAVLQDNIMLCDQKAGILLAFAAALILLCLEGLNSPDGPTGWLLVASRAGLALAGLAFMASCAFALATVVPRIRPGPDDQIFWESPVFSLSVDDYVARFADMDVEVERQNKLRYLHTMAGICRAKFRHFRRAIRFGEAGFLLLVLAELIKILA